MDYYIREAMLIAVEVALAAYGAAVIVALVAAQFGGIEYWLARVMP